MLADVVFRPGSSATRWASWRRSARWPPRTCPCWPIGGADDRATPPAAARRIAETAPRGELLLIDDTGHFPFAEAPERYWPALEAWLLSTGA